MTPERGGGRLSGARPTVRLLDQLDHQRTSEARIEAASSGLASAMVAGDDLTFAAVSAVTLLDAALRDLRAARA
jgi:hypothetical protein